MTAHTPRMLTAKAPLAAARRLLDQLRRLRERRRADRIALLQLVVLDHAEAQGCTCPSPWPVAVIDEQPWRRMTAAAAHVPPCVLLRGHDCIDNPTNKENET